MDPSLTSLKHFIDEKHPSLSIDHIAAVNSYWNQSIQTWSLQHFYLHGQVKTHIDTPISPDLILLAKNSHLDKLNTYGPPCNSMEAASIHQSISTFEFFVSAIALFHTI